MRKIIFGIITLLTFSCNEKPKTEFSLSGKTYGIENGAKLYLNYNNNALDSTVVQDNSFEFKTKLPKTPMKLWLHNKDFSNYRAFWAEDNTMTFDATRTNFRNAIITGSETEELSFNLHQEIDTLSRSERQKKEIEFVKNNSNSIVSASLLSLYSTTWGKEKTKELFDSFSSENKNTKYGKSIAKYIKLNKNPNIGENYVDFEMEDTNGETKKLSDLEGKLILLEFWSSNCGPCRKENPNLVKTYEKFKPKGFEIFAVSQDTKKESWLKAIEKDKLPWLQVSDLKGRDNSASLIYGINGIPDNFLIDPSGIIVGRNLRGERLNEKLNELLN